METYKYEQFIQRLDTIIYQLNQLTEALTEPIEDENNENTTRNEQERTKANQ